MQRRDGDITFSQRADVRTAFSDPRRRITANPHANGGLLRRPLEMPDFRDYAVKVDKPGQVEVSSTDVTAHFLRDVMRRNMTSFRVFGPDETASNKLQAIYEASGKTWMEEMLPEDKDGGFLANDGRVMEMLSEHTLEGWFEGYVLTGRHGFFSSYEAFVHIIDSMFNQHSKWLEKSKLETRWRAPISSINLLITSLALMTARVPAARGSSEIGTLRQLPLATVAEELPAAAAMGIVTG